VPTFWTDVHGAKMRSARLPTLADEAYMREGSLEELELHELLERL
jgi:hypothetical protein